MKECMKVFLSIIFCTGALLLSIATEALAQTSTGTVLGVVSDQSGVPFRTRMWHLYRQRRV